ncbi:hypothetical protein KAR91_07800, partial [Candidatus Pacearchaeota archaeon]|nr:hypothetical protein [Candidatus Pacearchaeota archaeon]
QSCPAAESQRLTQFLPAFAFCLNKINIKIKNLAPISPLVFKNVKPSSHAHNRKVNEVNEVPLFHRNLSLFSINKSVTFNVGLW